MKNRDIFSITMVILFFLTFPYIAAALGGGEDKVFIGFLLNPKDGVSYLAKMYQGWSGSWQFTLPFTAESGQGTFLFLFYLFLGHLARWTSLPTLLVFHLARMLCACFLLYTIFRFLSRFFPCRPDLLRNAFLLAGTGAGLGWLIVFTGRIPFDFWVAEAFPFLSMYSNPHFPGGMGLLILCLDILQDPPSMKRNAILLGGGLLVAIIYPFGLVVLLALAVGWFAWRSRQEHGLDWAGPVSIGLLGGPFLLYQYLITLQDPLLQIWNQQNLTLTPNFFDVLFSLSPVFLFAIPGGIWLAKQQDQPGKTLLFLWTITGFVLAYMPLSLQRRFTFGIYLPLAVLAVFGIDALHNRYAGWTKRIFGLVFALSLLTNLLLIASAMLSTANHPPLLYMDKDEVQALAWMEQELPANAVILASPEFSLLIPAITGRRVVYAHPYETIFAAEKEQAVLGFFQEPGWSEQKMAMLEKNRVDYLIYGPREIALGEELDLSRLALVQRMGSISIYSIPQAP